MWTETAPPTISTARAYYYYYILGGPGFVCKMGSFWNVILMCRIQKWDQFRL